MFYIVENKQQLDRLRSYPDVDVYLDIISSNDNFHPKLTSTIAVYIRPLDETGGYIIPINHDEGLNVSKDEVFEILKAYKRVYVLDKKNLLYHFPLIEAIDINLWRAFYYYEKIELPGKLSTINWFYNKFKDFNNINQIIPLAKLHEQSEKVFESIEKYIEEPSEESFNFYNNIAVKVFYLLEQHGLQVIYQPFIDLFKPNTPKYNIVDNIVYTYYNLYNSTSRPTNAFNSVNFAAIPKDEEYRKAIIPQYDCFVEFDFDGYHLRLLAEQVDFNIQGESAHKALGSYYFGKEDITQEEYQEAKQINFQAIYGKIPEGYKHLEIFEKIQNYINYLWNEFQKGEACTPISNKPFNKNLKDMHPQKLMNYVMQSLETARNVLILKDVLKYLRDKKTKIALYTYDAILFDFSNEDGESTLDDLAAILSENKKYPVKIKRSENLVL
jgi:hypothetical protein